MSQNPLLTVSTFPHEAVPFDRIQPEHFLPALDSSIAEAKAALEKIRNSPASFPNTIEELESAGEQVSWISAIFYNLLGAETNEQLQKLAQDVGPRLASFSSDLLLDEKLFAKV